MKKMTVAQVEEMLEELGYGNFGFRGASKRDLEIAKISDHLEASLDLCDERDCDYDPDAETLDGTCAICLDWTMSASQFRDRFEMARGYANNYHDTDVVYLISGKHCEYGEDPEEVILRDDFESGAKIVAVVTAA